MIFVTGGTGLVGSHLIYDLIQKGEKVRALKRTRSNTKFVEKVFSFYTLKSLELFNKIEWVEGDILDVCFLNDTLKGVDQVYHCAAIVSFNSRDRERIIQENITGTANMVNASLEQKVKKYCQVSSIAAIGKSKITEPASEDGQWILSKNKSAYSISKHQSEREVWRGIAEGLSAIIVNPSIILGPGNWETGSSKFFSTAFKGLKYYTKGISGFVDVRDVSRSMIMLMGSNFENERFILSSGNYSYQYLFTKITQELEVPPPHTYAKRWMTGIVWRVEKMLEIFLKRTPLITKETSRSAHSINCFSNEKIKQKLNFKFISIDQSINEISNLYLKDNGLKDD
ncbi:MAG: NAD-dependent epimerase/dehydratase family protein [Bacteroidetes bacterium]|nr:NAD-dependent epimerase/dehydratase family protein [Bacteroidota bacterium]